MHRQQNKRACHLQHIEVNSEGFSHGFDVPPELLLFSPEILRKNRLQPRCMRWWCFLINNF